MSTGGAQSGRQNLASQTGEALPTSGGAISAGLGDITQEEINQIFVPQGNLHAQMGPDKAPYVAGAYMPPEAYQRDLDISGLHDSIGDNINYEMLEGNPYKGDSLASQVDMELDTSEYIHGLDDDPLKDVDVDGLMTAMLENGDTIESLPKEYQDILMADPDALVHYISDSVQAKDGIQAKDARADIRGIMDAIGLDVSTYEKRAGAENRVATGASLALTEAYNGIENIAQAIGEFTGLVSDNPAYQKDISDMMEEQLASDKMADAKLFHSLNPVSKEVKLDGGSFMNTDPVAINMTREGTKDPVDMATPIGEALPSMAMSAGIGYSAQMASSLSKGVNGVSSLKGMAIADAVADMGLEATKMAGETKEFSAEQLAINALGGALGYKLTPSGWLKVQDANRELISSTKDVWTKAEYRNIVDSFGSNKAKGYMGESTDDLKKILDNTRGELSFDPAIVSKSTRGRTWRDTNTVKWDWAGDSDATPVEELLKTAKTPDELIDNILSNEKNVPKELVTWAKKIKSSNDAEKYSRYGVNGLMLYLHMPAGLALSAMNTPTVRNLVKKGGVKKIVKDTVDYGKSLF